MKESEFTKGIIGKEDTADRGTSLLKSLEVEGKAEHSRN